jgi:two-component system NtrC family response regulator
MNIDLQAKLLRVIETGEFYRVGDSKMRKSNVRFIAATNRNLLAEAEKGNFRSDLYYRLSVFTITLPSLRERKQDIKILASFFIKQFSRKTNKPELSMTADFLRALEAHAWKGNIRELKNVIERSVILSDDQLAESVLPSDFLSDSDTQLDLASVEKHHIRKVLSITNGNKTQAAKVLGIGLTTLYQKLKDYNIS